MELSEAVGVAIESERVASRISRRDLAKQLGVSEETLRRHIIGEVEPTVSRLAAIADALDCRPQDLFDRADMILGRAERRHAQSVEGDGNMVIGWGLGELDGHRR